MQKDFHLGLDGTLKYADLKKMYIIKTLIK